MHSRMLRLVNLLPGDVIGVVPDYNRGGGCVCFFTTSDGNLAPGLHKSLNPTIRDTST